MCEYHLCVHLSRCVGVSVGLCEALCGSVCIEGRLCVCVKRLHAHKCLYLFIGSAKTFINMHNIPYSPLKHRAMRTSCPVPLPENAQSHTFASNKAQYQKSVCVQEEW